MENNYIGIDLVINDDAMIKIFNEFLSTFE